MKIEIVEIASTTDSTASMLFIDDVHCFFVIEDGYRANKVAGKTRIPPGPYYLQARMQGRFAEQYKRKFGHPFAVEIMGIENFSDVLIHIGNTVEDTRGCPLICMGFRIDKKTGNYVGIDSTIAYKDFFSRIKDRLDKGEYIPLIVVRNRVDVAA